MKRFLKYFSLKLIVIFLCLFGTSSVFAQDSLEKCDALYKEFSANRKGPEIEKYKKAITAGKKYKEDCSPFDESEVRFFVDKQLPIIEKKLEEVLSLFKECESIYQEVFVNYHGKDINRFKEILPKAKEYVEKCGDLEGNEEVKTYLIKQTPKIEQKIKEAENEKVYTRFNSAVRDKNWVVVFATGKEIISINPDIALDLSLILAFIGYENASASPPVDKYNDEAISYAKMALQLMSEGKTSQTGDYGAFSYRYKTKNCPDGKTNATGWMNYIIGYITFYRLKNVKDAIPYFYQSTEGCETKNIFDTYSIIGDWYLNEVTKSYKSTNDETQLTLALQQALDAFARAYVIASQTHRYPLGSLRNKVIQLFTAIYGNDLKNLDLFLKDTMNTPFVDPAKPFKPLPRDYLRIISR